MKNVAVLVFVMTILFQGFSQSKPASPKKPNPGAKPAAPAKPVPVMKNALDSFSYALGLSMAGFYREQGVQDINTALVTQALNDIKAGTPRLQEADVNNAIISYMQTAKSSKAAPNKKMAQAFLDSNKVKAGVITLPSGLQYQVLKEGSGAKPALTDKVKVHYEGSLVNGKIFDSSVQRGEPIELNVNGVIPGWTEALQLMPTGSKWKLFIPSDLGYGDNGAGADIKPGDALIFDVELLEIIK